MNKNKEKMLYNRFKDSTCESGGEFFIKYEAAMDFVDFCKKNHIAIIGIEGFTINKGSTGSGVVKMPNFVKKFDFFRKLASDNINS